MAFRLDEELVEGLRRAARREGVSENAFVQSLLWQRIKADPLIHSFPYLVLSRRSFVPILGTSNTDSLELAALEVGKKNFALARELYLTLQRRCTAGYDAPGVGEYDSPTWKLALMKGKAMKADFALTPPETSPSP